MLRYPETALWQEVTYLAYHLHWTLDDLLDLEHAQRTRLLTMVADVDGHGEDRRDG